ncbi:E3 ubiquitin-protein ligase [Metarhizium album ARSEF 1941]|uniref:HECT-type E3 ubiquitin transferase n=1 Tax=Metarhizium album (strain ARSEF 1941) TaxID=1081103 RepID=A0A0B2WZR3_METAS|nr:E3 ubiquitin-protein ligase [Metarhizium album ARSEF 1941]KHO01742.1 E3 ubiquitin-protein ligase [Metarhizium album ARSEF 1941]
MFSTFTGSSRRPRNVNLSGQAGNPFANTSWSPAVVSNATKTVSDAQAEREKRYLERQRLKAAAKIQRIWRGHITRRNLANQRRAIFDNLYRSSSAISAAERLPVAFSLLLYFFSRRSDHDIQRTCLFARDCESAHVDHIAPRGIHRSRLRYLASILVSTLHSVASEKALTLDVSIILGLITRLAIYDSHCMADSLDQYYTALATLCKGREAERWNELLFTSLITPLQAKSNNGAAYKAFASNFFTRSDLYLFENNNLPLSRGIKAGKLAESICSIYESSPSTMPSPGDLLWLLAHYIGLGRASLEPSARLSYLRALLIQLSYLSSEISIRMSFKPQVDDSDDENDGGPLLVLAPYVSSQLLSLVDHDGISNVLRDFSSNLARSDTEEESFGTSLLAGYLLTLSHCFPAKADDMRMRLFLEQIPTSVGPIPTVKFLWQIMRQTSVFDKMSRESENPLEVIRRYFRGSFQLSQDSTEEQEWRVILLFLDLYTFILRLSDDEDFLSGMKTQIIDNDASDSRLRQCSLSLVDVEALTTFLKNTAFVLLYQAREISQSQKMADGAMKSRLDSYPEAGKHGSELAETATSPASTKVDLDGLRAIITTALKMLYERDSRKHFLPTDHWLMNNKLQQEDFINAVITEEERQIEEEAEESGEDEAPMSGGFNQQSNFYSTMAGQRVSRHARLEGLKRQQIRSQRERRLAEMGPKLEILKHMPFAVPFETRVKIFRQFINLDKIRRGVNNAFGLAHLYSRHHAKIRRGQLFEDAFNQFYQINDGLKDTIQITFVDQFGTPEAGIDGGGVTKEFLIGVTSEAFGNKEDGTGMFSSNEQGLLFPNPTAVDTRRELVSRQGLKDDDEDHRDEVNDLLRRFEFLGRIVGKCLYEGILVDLAFAGFFLLKWPSAGPNDENTYKGSINDLRDMDEELYLGLLRLKNYRGDVSELGFDFTVTDQVSPPGAPVKTITRKLIQNGDQIPVTNDNRLLYISYAARHRLVVQPALQTAAFLRGLRSIIPPSWLSMFNQSELQRLVGGDSSEIDIDDLRRNTVYSGLYEVGDDNEEHPTIKSFWRVMEGFTDAQRRDVLKYVSSTPRAPLLGFSQLRPKFSIRDGGTDEKRLPSTSTCVNLLKLPVYTSEEALREKLLYAVTSGAGFDLS